MSDTLEVFGTEFTGVTGIKAYDDNSQLKTYIRPQGTKSISANGTGIDVTSYASVDVSVPTGTARTSADLSASGATVTVPAGLYAEAATKSVASGSLVATAQFPVTPAITVDGNGLVTASVEQSGNTSPVYTSGWIDNSAAQYVTVSAYNTKQLSTQAATTITPTTSAQTAVAAGKYTTGAVTVSAMPSGTEGTPTATKGTVSNHAISVTPSVTNSAGYISGGSHSGTAVSVSASELVSGTLSITSSGTKDVTNYASASVGAMTLPTSASSTSSGTSKATISRSTSDQYINIPTGYNDAAAYYKVSAVANGTAGTPTASKGTVSNHSVSVTPSVTNTTGYITGSTKTGTAVTVSASELVSGSETKTANGTYDVTNLASLVVAIPIVTYYTSSSNPTSSQGSNGDIWLVTA